MIREKGERKETGGGTVVSEIECVKLEEAIFLIISLLLLNDRIKLSRSIVLIRQIYISYELFPRRPNFHRAIGLENCNWKRRGNTHPALSLS